MIDLNILRQFRFSELNNEQFELRLGRERCIESGEILAVEENHRILLCYCQVKFNVLQNG